jgi:hypothetical protein
LAINDFDGKEVENKDHRSILSKVGVGIMGLLGLEAPVEPHFAFFAEGRVSGDFQKTTYKKTVSERYD